MIGRDCHAVVGARPIFRHAQVGQSFIVKRRRTAAFDDFTPMGGALFINPASNRGALARVLGGIGECQAVR